jgi:hypothetical protein
MSILDLSEQPPLSAQRQRGDEIVPKAFLLKRAAFIRGRNINAPLLTVVINSSGKPTLLVLYSISCTRNLTCRLIIRKLSEIAINQLLLTS